MMARAAKLPNVTYGTPWLCELLLVLLCLLGTVRNAGSQARLAGGLGAQVNVDSRMAGANASVGLSLGGDAFVAARALWLGGASAGVGLFLTDRWSGKRAFYQEAGLLAFTDPTEGRQVIRPGLALGGGFVIDISKTIEARLVANFLLDTKRLTRTLGIMIWRRAFE